MIELTATSYKLSHSMSTSRDVAVIVKKRTDIYKRRCDYLIPCHIRNINQK